LLHQIPEQVCEFYSLSVAQRLQQELLVGQQIGEGSIDGEATSVGEFHANSASVGWVGLTLNEGACLESVDAIGHGSAGNHGLGRQLPRG
jgi:hypothetical protein